MVKTLLEKANEAESRFGINPRRDGVCRLDLAEVFDNHNPVALEIGSGKGRFLVEAGRENPAINYVGVEKSLRYYRHVLRRLASWDVRNARIVNYDAAVVVEEMLASQSIAEIHIYFPDPWPRSKHHKRRIVREDVLQNFARILEPSGHGVYVTDHAEYFEAAVPEFREYFEVMVGEVSGVSPRTNYEAKYRKEGRPIYEVRFSGARYRGR